MESKLKETGHNIVSYAVKNFNAITVDRKLDHFFNNLAWATIKKQ